MGGSLPPGGNVTPQENDVIDILRQHLGEMERRNPSVRFLKEQGAKDYRTREVYAPMDRIGVNLANQPIYVSRGKINNLEDTQPKYRL